MKHSIYRKGELSAAHILKAAEQYFKESAKTEHTFFDLKDNITGNRLRVDAFFEKNKVLLEVHGAQHYIPVRFGNITQETATANLRKYERRDRIRQQYCIDNGYKYVCIPYNTTKETFVDVIERQLNQHIMVVGKKFDFAYGHRLHNPTINDEENMIIFGKCNNFNGHGHNMQMWVKIRGFVDPLTGMVINYVELKRLVNKIIDMFDHKNLDKDNEYFKSCVSTCENTAQCIWDILIIDIPNICEIELWEAEGSSCIISRETIKRDPL